MENTIVLSEERSTIDKFKNWYKEKLIATGKTKNFEEKLDKSLKLEKNFIKIAGTVATIVLIFCPADGPVGEICTALATPLLAKLVDLKEKIVKSVVIGGKRKLEGTFIGADGSSKNIEVPEFDLNKLPNDFNNLKNTIEEFEKGVKKWKMY